MKDMAEVVREVKTWFEDPRAPGCIRERVNADIGGDVSTMVAKVYPRGHHDDAKGYGPIRDRRVRLIKKAPEILEAMRELVELVMWDRGDDAVEDERKLLAYIDGESDEATG